MSEESMEDKIRNVASQPKLYEHDGEKVQSQSLTELIAADSHLSKKRVARNPFKALHLCRMSTQGPQP